MPINCYNDITIGAEPEIIQMLVDCQFSFEILRPLPEGPAPEDYKNYWNKWCAEHWGTTWDRNEYAIIHRGNRGVNIVFTTAWTPPLELLKFLVDKYKIWIKCQWREEGGLSGIFIGQHTGERADIREFVWEGWSLEEDKERMGS
jgi:hypothetical protein